MILLLFIQSKVNQFVIIVVVVVVGFVVDDDDDDDGIVVVRIVCFVLKDIIRNIV